jgi:hypothetical protein
MSKVIAPSWATLQGGIDGEVALPGSSLRGHSQAVQWLWWIASPMNGSRVTFGDRRRPRSDTWREGKGAQVGRPVMGGSASVGLRESLPEFR